MRKVPAIAGRAGPGCAPQPGALREVRSSNAMPRSPYVIGDLPGMTPQIGRLASMMNYARRTTLSDVAGLSMTQLDYLHDRDSNSIGGLLLHIASVERWYQANTFEDRDLDA